MPVFYLKSDKKQADIIKNHFWERRMFAKLEETENRYEELAMMLYDPDVLGNSERYNAAAKEYSELTEVVETYRSYKKNVRASEDAKELLAESTDKEFRALAQSEYDDAEKNIEDLSRKLKILLAPKDPNDEKNVILEIRAGAGGEEAALFARDLLRMYSGYADTMNWQIETVDMSDTELGGIKEGVFTVTGKGAYSKLKFESGVHRVQRVPTTESGGRIHTSTATVAVLPEVSDVEVDLNMADLQIDTYRSGGAGGQHINKTSSAIRITHKPTGIVVTCQDERSQLKNKEKALKVLRAKLYDMEAAEQADSVSEARRQQVGTGDRSEKIRTYNFHDGRVTDHRINLTLYKLESILNGDLEELVEALTTYYRAQQLAGKGPEES